MDLFFESGMHWKLLNFFVFIGLCVFLLRKPAAEFWKGRAHKIGFDMEEAKRLRREAATQVLELEKKIGRLDLEAAAIKETLRKEGEMEKKKIIQDAHDYALKLKKDAERIVQQEIQKTKERLKGEFVEGSLATAEKLIKEQMKETDQERLGRAFLSGLEGRL